MWKDIDGYEGLYQVSNTGEVMNVRTGKILKAKRDKDGYFEVCLCKNGKRYFRVHRLVADAFIPNSLNLPQVNHKDENPSNNNASNLEWCSCEYNINYGTGIRRRVEKQSKPILQYTKSGELVREWSSISECGRNGFNISHICECCQNKPSFKSGNTRRSFDLLFIFENIFLKKKT